MEYKIVTSDNPTEIETEVNKLIKDGFKPLGGVSVCGSDDWEFYTQAMVR